MSESTRAMWMRGDTSKGGYVLAADLDDLIPPMSALPGFVVIDHMDRPDVAKAANPAHQRTAAFLARIVS